MFQSEITYLAHLIDKDGIRPTEEHLKAILEYFDQTLIPPSNVLWG